jgi:poly [ADP-ribose] polymerase
VLSRADPEFGLLSQYIHNTYYEGMHPNQPDRRHLKHIIRLTKDSEALTFKTDLSNRLLLFHGSKVSNFLGILAQGLRVQPLEVQRNGNLLGKGIYFTDMLTKALMYTGENANVAGAGSSRFVLVCEVALG